MKHVATFCFIIVLLLSSATVYAQIPRTISYQGVLSDASGNLIPNGNHQLTLKLYTIATGSTAIYTEVQTVPVVKGVFNAIIGSVTAIPVTVAFDRAYFLGVSVDGGTELSPRTALVSAPYALRASYADVAGSVVGGGGGNAGVSSLNALLGDVVLVGGGSTTINKDVATKKITISSSGGAGASGVQGIQNTDGSISVLNPNGPVATLSVTNGSIGTQKITDSSITTIKIAPGVIPTQLPPNGPANGDLIGSYPNPNVAKIRNFNVSANVPQNSQALIWNAGNNSWEPTNVTISLPFVQSDNSSSPSMSITNTNGSVGIKGTGLNGVWGFSTDNNGKGVYGSSGNIGVYGLVGNSGPNPTASTGIGVFGTTDVAIGVAGTSSAGDGVQGLSTLSNGYGVHGISSTGTSASGVYGESATGIGVKAGYSGNSTSGTSLYIDNGFIKVGGNSKTAYVHTAGAANIIANSPWVTFLNYPGMLQTDIVLVTHQLVTASLKKNLGGNVFDGIGYGVQWNGALNRWEIFLEDQATNIPNGERFNILVIRQ